MKTNGENVTINSTIKVDAGCNIFSGEIRRKKKDSNEEKS